MPCTGMTQAVPQLPLFTLISRKRSSRCYSRHAHMVPAEKAFRAESQRSQAPQGSVHQRRAHPPCLVLLSSTLPPDLTPQPRPKEKGQPRVRNNSNPQNLSSDQSLAPEQHQEAWFRVKSLEITFSLKARGCKVTQEGVYAITKKTHPKTPCLPLHHLGKWLQSKTYILLLCYLEESWAPVQATIFPGLPEANCGSWV